jgi:hypothetical protein
MEEHVHLCRGHAPQRLVLRDEPLIRHVHRNAHLCLGRAFSVAGLQEPERPALDGELHVLHVPVVTLQPPGDLHQLIVERRRTLLEDGDGIGGPDPRHDVLALSVLQIVSLEDGLTGGPVTGHADSGGRPFSQIPEHHGLDVDCGTQIVSDPGGVPVVHGTLAVPGTEHGLGGSSELLPGIAREVAPREGAHDALVCLHDGFPVLTTELRVERKTGFRSRSFEDVLEVVVRDVEDDAAEHMEETPIKIVGEPGVAGGGSDPLGDLVVEPQVENRVHHPRHRELRPGTARQEQRVIGIPEAPAHVPLEGRQRLDLLVPETLGEFTPRLQVGVARSCRGGEPRRNRNLEAGHIRQVGSLASEKAPHSLPVACDERFSLIELREEIDVLLHGVLRERE